jgi:hypothetical protein
VALQEFVKRGVIARVLFQVLDEKKRGRSSFFS